MHNLLVVDGSALLSIIFYASISDVTKQVKDTDTLDLVLDKYFRKGHGHYTENVGAFVNMLVSLKKQTLADSVVVCFDKSSETTFRKKQCPFYKETRQKKPKALKDQMIVLHCLLNNIGITTFWSDEYEADDLAGSLINRFKSEFDTVYFYTKDRDWLQLLDQNVKGIMPMRTEEEADAFRCYYSSVPENNGLVHSGPKVVGKNLCISVDICKDFYEVYANQVVDFKALAGDKSDNIPGIKGIGEDTAKGLLEIFGSLDNILNSVDGVSEADYKELVKGYIKRNPYNAIVSGKKDAKMSQWLATIRTNLPVPFNASKLKWNLNKAVLREGIEVYNLEDDLDYLL